MFDTFEINKRVRICNFTFGELFEYSEENKKLLKQPEKFKQGNTKTIFAVHIPPELDDKKIAEMMKEQGIETEGWRYMSKGAVVAIRPEDYRKYVGIEKTVKSDTKPLFRIGHTDCSTEDCLLGRDLINLIRYKLECEFSKNAPEQEKQVRAL